MSAFLRHRENAFCSLSKVSTITCLTVRRHMIQNLDRLTPNLVSIFGMVWLNIRAMQCMQKSTLGDEKETSNVGSYSPEHLKIKYLKTPMWMLLERSTLYRLVVYGQRKHKSSKQMIEIAGVDLQYSCFLHGQLSITWSMWVTKGICIFIMVIDNQHRDNVNIAINNFHS